MPIIYKVYDSIPLSFVRIKNGLAITGLSVTVSVQATLTGATLLSTTTLTEVTAGLYVYNWNHGILSTTECVATYTVSGLVFKEFFAIDDTIKQVQQEEGRAS